jgi:hypothetical protein
MADEGLDDCTHYEGKDGYALVDGATYESMRRNLAIIEDGYYHLQRENERLRAIVDAIEPGTAAAFVMGLFELAVRECGMCEFSSEPPIASVERELTRREREVERLRELVKQAHEEGVSDGRFDSSYCLSSEWHWENSDTKEKLG